MSPTELIDAQLEDELDEAGSRELEAWLLADPANRRRYLRAVLDHRALLRLHAVRIPRNGAVRRPRMRRPAQLAPWMALAALLLLTVGAGLWLRPAPPRASGPLVVEAGAGTVARDGDPRALSAGDALHAGDRIAIGGGGLTLRFADGTRVRLAADSTARIDDERTGLRLLSGSLAAEVEPQRPGAPALFTAPGTTVTVIGTALEVATADGETSVAVGHGRVAVRRDADGASTEVGTGEECLVPASGPLKARPRGTPTGRILAVGAGQPFADLAAVPEPTAGDVIEIHPGTYRAARRWPVAGTRLRPVVIRGVGATRPRIDGEGLVLSGQGQVPRALLQIDGGHYAIEGLDLANGRNGELAAGIRGVAVRSLTVRDCRISACDQGIDAIADEMLVDGCELRGNGLSGSRTVTSALRLVGSAATIRGCLIDDTRNGVSLRAAVSRLRLEANRIGGGEEGEVILGPPTGGGEHAAELIGNLLVGRAGRTGNRARFISIEGGTARVELRGNTCVAADPRVVFLAATGGTHRVRADACIFAGSDAVAGPGIALDGSRDWFAPTATVPPSVTQRIPATGSDPGFIAPQSGDFRLLRPLGDSDGADQPAADQEDARQRREPPPTAGGVGAPRAPGVWIGAFGPVTPATP